MSPINSDGLARLHSLLYEVMVRQRVQKPGPAVRLLRLAFLLMLAIWLCAVYVAFYGVPDKFFNIARPILPTVSDPCSASAPLNFRTSGFQQAMRSKCFDSHE